MNNFTSKLFLCLLIYELGKTNALTLGGNPSSKPTIPKTALQNPFAPNSEIFKIPASKTVNLDLRKSNETKINSELLKILKDLFKNKDVRQEKVILNVKPPKNSNSSFVKNFTSLLRNETIQIVPDAVVGAQSTLFKKKSGQISTLRLTLYVVRQQRVVPEKKSKMNSLQPTRYAPPTVEEAKINISQAENITATVELVLKQLQSNSSQDRETNILLSLVSATNLTRSYIHTLQHSVKEILAQIYPNSSISMHTKLFQNKKSHTSKLEFEIDVKPKVQRKKIILKPAIETLNMTIILLVSNSTEQDEGSIFLNVTNKLENITKTLSHYMNILSENTNTSNLTGIIINLSFSKNVGELEKQKLLNHLDNLVQEKFPKFQSYIKVTSKSEKPLKALNIRILLLSKTKLANEENTLTSESLQANSELLQKDLQNLQPYAQVLKRTEDTINKDLVILEKTLELQNRKNRKSKISIDLTGGVSSFPEELEKILPQVLPTLKNSKQPTLEFEITIPSYSPESTVSSDICSIVNTLLTKVPERTQFGDVNIEVTLSKKPIMQRSLISDDYKSPIALSQAPINAEISHPPKPETTNILDLTGNGVNTVDEINNTLTELFKMLPSQNNPRTLNLSMVLPINETSLVENILDIIRKDLKMLFPYSQVLLQAQKTIADDLHILELNIELKKSLEKTNRPKKFIEEIPIDLSHLHEDIQKDLDKLLVPVWTHMSKSKPLVFNLELRPVNDISRNRLSNEICSIVDTLIKSLPSETNLNELSLRMTVTPDEDEMDMSDKTENSWKTEEILPIIVDAADSSKNETYRLHEALKKIAEELKNNLNSNTTTVPYLVLRLPKTANVEEALREIKDDLSKLAPLEDIVLKSQQDLQDDVLTLQLAIEFHHENRRKKFRIELSEMGDFIPEEVDEIVYDIRQSENSFSFDLQMVLPQGADLDEGNSEICSVVNVVINNVPQQSILKDNVLRVSVSPKQNVKSEELIPSTESNEEIINLQKPNIPEKNELNSATRSLPSWPNEENVNESTKINQNNSPMALVNDETEYTNNMRGVNNPEWMPPKKRPIKNTWRKQISNNAPVNVQPTESVIGRENIQNPWNVVNSNSPRIFRKPALNPQSSEINEEEEKQNNIMNPNVWKQFPNSMQNIIKNRLLTEPTTKSEALIENPIENEWMRNDYTTQPEELEPEPKIAEEVKSSPNVYKEFETTMSPTVRSPIANKFEELKSSLLNGLPYISPFPSARNYNQIRKQVTPRSRTLVGEAEEKVTPTQNIPKIRMITERIPTTVNSIPQGNNWVSWTPLPTQNSYSMTLEETTTNEIINEYVTESLENIERIENTPLSNTPLRNNLIETEENTNTNNIRAENEKDIVPKYDNVKEETLIKAYDNDQFGVLHYIEKIDLSNSSMNMVDVITNTTTSLIKIIPRESEETLELNLNIFLPEDTTVDDLKNVTNSVMSTLLTSLPKDIINVQTKTDEEDEKIDYAEMKITISPNTSLGRDIEEKEKLESEVKKESQLVKNLTILLDNLKTNIDSYNSVQKYLELNDQVVSEKQKSFINSNKMLLDNVYSIVSNILLAIKKDPDFKELKFNYTLEPPKDEGVSYRHLLDYSLKKLLAEYMPFEEVETNITANNNQSLLEVQVSVKPRVNFTTPTINLDSLNILDVEEVLTRIISNYVSVIKGDNSIIIDFVFNTTHISSLNLENIESAIEDVLDYFNLKNELLSDDVELELIDNKFIDIHMPFKVSVPVSKKVSSSIHIQTEKPKIPKPSDMISDLILAI